MNVYIYTVYKQHIDTRPALPGKELSFSLFQPAVKNHFKKKPRARQKVAWHREIFHFTLGGGFIFTTRGRFLF